MGAWHQVWRRHGIYSLVHNCGFRAWAPFTLREGAPPRAHITSQMDCQLECAPIETSGPARDCDQGDLPMARCRKQVTCRSEASVVRCACSRSCWCGRRGSAAIGKTPQNRMIVGKQIADNTPLGGLPLLRWRLAELPQERLSEMDDVLHEIANLMGVTGIQ